jgi:cytochrome c553
VLAAQSMGELKENDSVAEVAHFDSRDGNVNADYGNGRACRCAGEQGAWAELYKARCRVCHGPELKGIAGIFPSLIGVTERVSDADIKKQIRNGKGRMLAFPDLSEEDLDSLVLFLKTWTANSASKSSLQGESK